MLNFENSLNFAAGRNPPIGLRNFWEPEDGFIWSTNTWCELEFPFDPGTGAAPQFSDLILDIDAFKVEGHSEGQSLRIYLNGLQIGTLFCNRRITAVIGFRTRVLTRDENVLIIDTPDAHRPSDFGDADNRVLGLKLHSLQVRRAE